MKHLKLYEELKFNEKQYHTYELLNLVQMHDLGSKGEAEMIDMINSGQIDLNLQDQLSYRTALIYSMINRYEKVFDELIKSDVNLDLQDNNGNTALIISAIGSTGSSSDYYISIMEKLIDAGADWNKTQNYGREKDFLEHIQDNEFKRHILKKYHKQYEIYLMKKTSEKFNI
jgi:ankyrin repeat protein